jgi:hypothetical protein
MITYFLSSFISIISLVDSTRSATRTRWIRECIDAAAATCAHSRSSETPERATERGWIW